MTGRLDLTMCGLALAGALSIGGVGCARAITLEGTGSTGGDGGSGGTGGTGGSATTTTTSHDGTCVLADDCLDFSGTCVVGTCINGQCTTQPANELGACDDGLFCTTNDSCQNGLCIGGPTLTCPGSDACHVGACDELTDTCGVQPGNNGAQCDDNDPCTYFGSCSNGVCSKGPAIDCSFLNSECAIGTCDPVAGCKSVPVNDGQACDDGQFCTTNDSCQAGVCSGGAALPCAPPGGCYVGTCDEIADTCTAVPGNDGAACDDLSPCTDGTTCLAGLCTNGTPVNDGAACDDGTSCTMGETCAAGLCTNGAGPTVYFSEDFKDNSKGWTLGPEWQIGSATVSIPGSGNPDPGEDHTASIDNGIAGVAIGGNAQTVLHDFYWLESPTFDTSIAAGPVIFGFFRWLNSDYDPYMHNKVEVYDGAQWVNLWTTGSFPGIEDAAWTFQEFDVTAYKNAGMRVRFGFDIASGGVYTIGSWNVDDVLIASAACP